MILAIDTATHWTGIALHDGALIVAENGWRAVNTTTVALAPAVEEMLRRVGRQSADIQAIAVTIGPGSYTGLRVGLAFAKGMALALGIPLIGVNTLAVVVAGFGENERLLVSVAEAGRKRVAAATWHWYSRTGWGVKGAADTWSWPDLIAATKEGSIFVGEIDAEARRLLRASDKQFHVMSPSASTRRAAWLAEIGYLRWRRGDVDDAAALAPIYLREPDGSRPISPP
jgi:tRNA threonylcarbamoyladenosine biosynthesis protein TsaB